MEQNFSVLLLFTLFFTSIFFAVPFFSTSILAQSKETGILYLWEISSGKVWKSFGDDETQQKYKGEIKEEKPEGLGVPYFLMERNTWVSGTTGCNTDREPSFLLPEKK